MNPLLSDTYITVGEYDIPQQILYKTFSEAQNYQGEDDDLIMIAHADGFCELNDTYLLAKNTNDGWFIPEQPASQTLDECLNHIEEGYYDYMIFQIESGKIYDQTDLVASGLDLSKHPYARAFSEFAGEEIYYA